MPCIVGEWGYFMDFAGKDVLKKHWRYIVARYSAYPVTWCAAGEAMMNYYLLKDPQRNTDEWKKGRQAEWSDLVRHIRALDPNKHPITIHPTQFGRQQVDDPAVLDFEMLQTGHSGFNSLANTLNSLEKSLAADPTLPVLIGEVNYEGIMESSREEIQRFIFWTAMLSGAMGHTYGANGIWQVNGRETPYGLSPHGSSWGNRPWDEAAALPGSGQLGIAKRLLERYPWQQFQPHPEWVEPHQEPEKRMLPYAAGIPGQVRLIYIPAEASWIAWQRRADRQRPGSRRDLSRVLLRPDERRRARPGQRGWRQRLCRAQAARLPGLGTGVGTTVNTHQKERVMQAKRVHCCSP